MLTSDSYTWHQEIGWVQQRDLNKVLVPEKEKEKGAVIITVKEEQVFASVYYKGPGPG